jgi:hypothetical protein
VVCEDYRIGGGCGCQERARLGARKRWELLCLLRPCFARPEPWLQAGKYVSALASDLRKRNGWTIAEHAVDLCVPRISSTSCDQAVFVDQATDASLFPDAVLVEVGRFR